MPKFAYDGVIQLWYAEDIADPANPAITELDVDLTPFLRTLTTPDEGSTIDASTAETTFNATVRGRHGGQAVSATFTRDKVYADDDAFTTLAFETTGFWVVARRGGTGTNGVLIATDRVDVFAIDVITRMPSDYGTGGTLAEVTVQCAVPLPPEHDVELSAS